MTGAALLCLTVVVGSTAADPGEATLVDGDPAPGGSPDSAYQARGDLAAGLTLLEAHDHEAALLLLEQASGDLTLEEMVRRLEGLGIAQSYLDRPDEAAISFEKLLVIAPGHTIPYTISPKASFVYETVRREALRRPSTSVRVDLPRAIPFGEPIEVVVVCGHNALSLVERFELCHRVKSEGGPYSCEDLRPAGAGVPTELTLPVVPEAAAVSSDDPIGASDEPRAWLQIALSGYDRDDNEVFRHAGRAQPLEVEVGAPMPLPWYANVWLWSSVGLGLAAVTSGAVIAAVLLQPTHARVETEVR